MLGVLLPILDEAPRSTTPEREVGSGEPTLQIGGSVSQSLADKVCAEEGAQEEEELPSRELDTGASGAKPSLSMDPEQREQVS